MKLVFDTNIYTDFAEGVPEIVDFIATHGERIYLPSIVMGELTYGFMKGSKQSFNEKRLQTFIHRLNVELIYVDENVARRYAIIYLALQQKGKKIPINDTWIAACTMEVGGTLLTKDRHFKVVEQIEAVILTS